MSTILIGLDAGTSRIKAAAYDSDGRRRAGAFRENPVDHPRPQWSEQGMRTTWEQSAAALRETVQALDSDDRVVGMAVTGQGGGCWCLDREGEPLEPAILWTDGRAARLVEEWRHSGVYDEVYGICGGGLFAGLSLPILRWLKDHAGDRFEAIDVVLSCKDWIKYCLTGVVGSDYSEVSIPVLDIRRREYSSEILEMVGLPELEEVLPPLLAPDQPVGTVTEQAARQSALPAGTPVSTGVMDVVASAFGSGAARPGESSSVLGTTAQNQTFMDQPNIEPRGIGYTLCVGEEPLWLRALGAMTGTPNLEWIREMVGDTRTYEELEADLREIPTGSEGVMYHPFLSQAGEKAPFLDPGARAQFTGLTPEHSADHLIRSVYEGVAMSMRDCYENMPVQSRQISLCGGGARSPLWGQMIADCLGIKVQVAEGEEFGARGAALIAASQQDIYPDIPTAVESTTRIDRSYRPREEPHQAFQHLYELYVDTYQAWRELWEKRGELPAPAGGNASS